MNRLALLPSARLVPIEMQAEFGAIPSAMIPLGGRPALSYIGEKYCKEGFEIAVAVGEGAQRIHDYLDDERSVVTKIIEIGSSASLGETIAKALDGLEQLPDTLAINFADTLVEDPVGESDAIFFARKTDAFRWTTFALSREQDIVAISEKNHEKTGEDNLTVFVGVFLICNVPTFMQDMKEAVVACDDSGVDPFYSAIRAYFNRIPQCDKKFIEVESWWDFGHPDTYYETKRKAFSRERSFNRVSIDESRGVLRKESSNVKKFHDEIRWYLRLPKSLQHLSPRIFDYSLDFDRPYVEMEFYGYPVLSDIYLYGAWDQGVWTQFFQGLRTTMARMAECVYCPADRSELIEAMRDMYEAKTVERLAPVLGDSRFARFRADHILINEVSCPGVLRALELIPSIIEAIDLYRQDRFSIIHGDLCLSNILYDSRNRIIRLIDPRGGFGAFDLYGDARYDLAKLDHSIEGDYDFYVNGLFDLEWHTDEQLTLRPYLRESHESIKRIYRQQMKPAQASPQQVRFIESLLFLSMVPLHDDRPLSQEAFLARGLLSISQVARETGLLP